MPFPSLGKHGQPKKQVKKCIANKPIFQRPIQTISQIFAQDNTMFLELDLEALDKQSRAEQNKRKSTEDCPRPGPSNKPFKTPKPPAKKFKESKEPAELPKDDDQEISAEQASQILVNGELPGDDRCLTQVKDCLSGIKLNESFIAGAYNHNTRSQYIELIRDNDEDNNEDFHNDSLNDLFNVALPEEGLKENIVENQNVNVMNNSFTEGLHALNSVVRRTEVPIPVKAKTPVRPPRRKLLPVSSNDFMEMGPFFGLSRKLRDFIFKTKNIDKLYDWQDECLGLRAIHERKNLIYALPTSGGKTLVAEIAMFREIMLRKKNVIFVLPYVSIVQEKLQDLTPFAMEFQFLIEDYCAGKGTIPPIKRRKMNSIYVCTIEKSQVLFDSLRENKRLQEIGLIVVDELHMIGDNSRGYSLETLLAKAIYQKDSRIQVIGMSATISNLDEVARFLKADIYKRDFRPVELTEYVKIGTDIMTIQPSGRIQDAFKVSRSNFGNEYTKHMLRNDPDHLTSLVLEVCPKAQCLVFCATKKNCEDVAKLLSSIFPLEFRKERNDEKMNVIDAIKADSNGEICPILKEIIPYGIAYHHSGLTADERKHIEEAYRLNIISVICCTSTLAAGVNLPAQRVIIRSPYVGPNFLTLTRYKQMVGRAGRAGKCDKGDSILVFSPKDYFKVVDLLCSKMDETISGFVQEAQQGVLMRTVILNLIGTKLANRIDELVDFFKSSLLHAQIYRLGDCNLRRMIVKHVKQLTIERALTVLSCSIGNRYVSFTYKVAEYDQEVYPDDYLDVSKLGQAAVNAGMSLEEAQNVEQILRKTNENLVMSQELQMLFVVTPNDAVSSVHPDFRELNNIIMRLEPSARNSARILGITESLAMRIVTRPGSVKESEKTLLKQFFVALILFELWHEKEINEVARKFKVQRGVIYNLMNLASSRAYSIYKFCEVMEEFWMMRAILEQFTKRLAYCCASELLPLMELPAVKIGRAKLMFAAGLKSVEDVATTTPEMLIQKVKNVNTKQAEQIIKGAKYALREKIETLRDSVAALENAVKRN